MQICKKNLLLCFIYIPTTLVLKYPHYHCWKNIPTTIAGRTCPLPWFWNMPTTIA